MELKGNIQINQEVYFWTNRCFRFYWQKSRVFLAICVVSKFECGIFEQLFLPHLYNLLLGSHGTVGSPLLKQQNHNLPYNIFLVLFLQELLCFNWIFFNQRTTRYIMLGLRIPLWVLKDGNESGWDFRVPFRAVNTRSCRIAFCTRFLCFDLCVTKTKTAKFKGTI